MLLFSYRIMTYFGTPLLWLLLYYRLRKGKEEASRLKERRGIPTRPSPKGHLVWLHAASVGEAQSALILIEKISLHSPGTQFLVTSGTVTSAALMAKRLPDYATHQYIPLDQSNWINRFLDHWQPDLAIWMESELWPNLLRCTKSRRIPAILINARLSFQSYHRWRFLKKIAEKLLRSFKLILAQTEQDAKYFEKLGAKNIFVTDNIKYSAAPLPANQEDLQALQEVTKDRKIWLYASTHAGEEEMACRIHMQLKEKHAGLLTIIVPRHPERRNDIEQQCKIIGTEVTLRGENKNLPTDKTDIYIADTLGELGLFYRLSPIAVIGRSFSYDGGGGHNPIEAAQLDCAILTGPNVQYQQKLFSDMITHNAAKQVQDEESLLNEIDKLLSEDTYRQNFIESAARYADEKSNNIDVVIEHIKPFIPARQKEAA